MLKASRTTAQVRPVLVHVQTRWTEISVEVFQDLAGGGELRECFVELPLVFCEGGSLSSLERHLLCHLARLARPRPHLPRDVFAS